MTPEPSDPRFEIFIDWNEADGCYVATTPQVPQFRLSGDSVVEAEVTLREALKEALHVHEPGDDDYLFQVHRPK